MTWLEDLKDSQAPRPSWWDQAARQKTLFGHPGKRSGQWNGGHAYGQNIPGKTEFPERWSDDDIDLVLAETWANPTAVRFEGDRRYAARVIDGVLVQIEALGDSFENFRTYYPVGGHGVFYNDVSRRVEKRIPRSGEGW
ncbi:MAG: EndoU domain-containing protein [Trueperella sp.]|uniref:EndoU domain-containing protein n=1 Tax=Trueperella sp. TaxID=2699835 RepID=UPI0025FE4758|nr:EndoU domain-containing protein [Trueperella sp.]MCI7305202.1 EndoU domain-containing protein [Trueperella sp.]MDY5403835.1 EndoU domain-containing protein [Trueperella sp.]